MKHSTIFAKTLICILLPTVAYTADIPLKKSRPYFSGTKRTQAVLSPEVLIYKPTKSVNFIKPFGQIFGPWFESGYSRMSYSPSGKILQQTDSGGFFSNRETHSYDAQDRETQLIRETFNPGTQIWENSSRDVSIYDANGNIQEQHTDNWLGNTWVISSGSQDLRTYNAQNRIIERNTKYWNSSNGNWENETLETEYIYDAQQRLQSYVSRDWDTTQWVNSEKTIVSYNGNDIYPIGAVIQEWNGSAFVDSARITDIQWIQWNGHPENSIPATYVMQVNQGGNWINSERITFTYDNFGSETVLTEIFFNGSWKNSTRFQRLVDQQYNPTFTGFEEYRDSSSAWDTTYGFWNVHKYDPDNRITETIVKILQEISINPDNPPVKRWLDFQKKVYTDYISVNITGQQFAKNPVEELQLIPNPVHSGMSFTVPDFEGNFQILDVQCKFMQQGRLQKGERISTRDLSAGMYQIQLFPLSGNPKSGRLMIH